MPKIAEAQIVGKRMHEKLEEEDLLMPREAASEEELSDSSVDLDIPREAVQIVIERFNKEKFYYIGKPDKIVRKNGNVLIIDDRITKKKHEPYPDKILQLCCYCEGFVRNFSNKVAFNKIFFKIVQRDSNGKILQEVERGYTDDLKEMLAENFSVFESIFNKDIRPTHHNNGNKCRACGFNCKWRMI